MTLPRGWAEATIGEVADTKLGKMLDAAKNKGEFVPYLRNINVRWGSFDLADLLEMKVTPTEFDELAVRDGDLFVCEGGEPGRAAVWRGGEQRIVFQKALHRVRPLAGVEPEYIARFIGHAAGINAFADLLTGTTIKHLPQIALQRLPLNVPPAAEQRRIVGKLDTLTTRLARARAELDRVPVLAKKLREVVLASLWSEPAELGLENLLAIPIRNGLSVAGSEQPPGVAALRLSALRGDMVTLSDVRYLPITTERAASYALRNGDMLVSRGNGTLALVGKAAIVAADDEKLPIFPDTAFRVRIDAEIACSRWLLRVWNSKGVRDQIEKVARTTAGIWKIAQRDLLAIKLPSTRVERQRALAKAIDAAFARADRLEAEAARARALLDRLEAAILARAFRGELVPQDPDDEPASVLLQRIRAERAAAPKTRRFKGGARKNENA